MGNSAWWDDHICFHFLLRNYTERRFFFFFPPCYYDECEKDKSADGAKLSEVYLKAVISHSISPHKWRKTGIITRNRSGMNDLYSQLHYLKDHFGL